MRAVNSWSFKPYRPVEEKLRLPFICRLAPAETSVELQWLGQPQAGLALRVRGSGDEFKFYDVSGNTARADGLLPDTDYEVFLANADGQSDTRLFRTGVYPGTVVNYLHPEDDIYAFSGHALCSPSFVRLENGDLLSSMDVFTGRFPQNLSLIFRSRDNGRTWSYVTDLFPCFWGRLFVYRGRLFMLSVSTEFGDLLIGESTDGGENWGVPTVLLRGAGRNGFKGVHKNPQPMFEYGGRLWFPLEWGDGHYGCMHASMPADADPLKPESWSFSSPVRLDNSWQGAAVGEGQTVLEGCLVECPDGKMRNILRYEIGHSEPSYGLALVMDIDTSDPEADQTFCRFMPFPGNHSKFIIKRDPVTGKYLSICSRITGKGHERDRNLLSLVMSDDLESWSTVTDLLDYTSADPKLVGFQYIDWFIEGDDILWLSRTAINGARNFHDANCQTFHRTEGFRALLKG